MQLSDLARAPRALLQEKSFIFVSSILLVLSVAATRVFISHYLIYRSDANANVVQLLEEQNLPYRKETRNAILAAVQSIFFGTGAVLNCGDPRLREDEIHLCNDLAARHRAFEDLVAAFDCPTRDGECAQQVAERAVSSWPDGNPARREETVRRLKVAISKLVPPAEHAEIQPCITDSKDVVSAWRRDRAGVHSQTFGPSGCDAPDVGLASTLLVPSRQNQCFANGNQPKKEGSREECYSERLLRSNDFSLLLDLLFFFDDKSGSAAPQSRSSDTSSISNPAVPTPETLSSDPSPGAFGIVQEYFIAPDSFIRYRDLKEHRPAIDVFGEARMWATSPFIQLPIDTHAKYRTIFAPNGALSLSPEAVADDLCRAIPIRPYVDLGDYGFVETRCSCAVDPRGELVGVYCSDYTIPYSLPERPESANESASTTSREPSAHEGPPGILDYIPRLFEATKPWLQRAFLEFRRRGENSLFDWRLVNVPDDAIGSTSCEEQISDVTERLDAGLPAGSSSRWPSYAEAKPIDPAEASSLCSEISSAKATFFQEVQTIPYRGSNRKSSMFFIPLSRTGASQSGSRLGILLRPNPAGPPWRSTILVIACWFLFATTFVWRARLHSMSAETLRDDAILRGLPVGVVDAAQWDRIEFANDRAEEILGASFPVFGTQKDSVLSRDVSDLIQDVMLVDRDENRFGSGHDGGMTTTARSSKWASAERPFRPITREEIDERRRLGEGSVYYARLRRNQQDCTRRCVNSKAHPANAADESEELKLWVRIRGNPLFGDESRQESRPRTFAIVQHVRRVEKQKALNDEYRRETARLELLSELTQQNESNPGNPTG